MSIKCLDALYNNTQVIQNCARELEELSKSFPHVGNNKVAAELYSISLDLMAAQKEITQAYALELSENLKATERATSRTVQIALGILGKEEIP